MRFWPNKRKRLKRQKNIAIIYISCKKNNQPQFTDLGACVKYRFHMLKTDAKQKYISTDFQVLDSVKFRYIHNFISKFASDFTLLYVRIFQKNHNTNQRWILFFVLCVFV